MTVMRSTPDKSFPPATSPLCRQCEAPTIFEGWQNWDILGHRDPLYTCTVCGTTLSGEREIVFRVGDKVRLAVDPGGFDWRVDARLPHYEYRIGCYPCWTRRVRAGDLILIKREEIDDGDAEI